MGVGAAVRLTRDAGPNHIADAKDMRPSFFGHANGGQGVGRLSRLTNGNQDVTFADDRVAVSEFTGIFDFHRNAGKVLEHVLRNEAGVPTGATGNNDQPLCVLPHVLMVVDAGHADGVLSKTQSAPQAIVNRAGLFVNLFEHEVLITAFFNGLEGHFQFGYHRGDFVVPNGADFHSGSQRNTCDLFVFQVDDVFRVFDNGRGVGGYEILSFANANDQRAGLSSQNQFFRAGNVDNGNGVGADHFVQGDPCGLEKIELFAACHDLFDEVHKDLCVRVTGKVMTASDEGLF